MQKEMEEQSCNRMNSGFCGKLVTHSFIHQISIESYYVPEIGLSFRTTVMF
jgi:hypothetical protein